MTGGGEEMLCVRTVDVFFCFPHFYNTSYVRRAPGVCGAPMAGFLVPECRNATGPPSICSVQQIRSVLMIRNDM